MPGTGLAAAYDRPLADRRALRALVAAQRRGDWGTASRIRDLGSPAVARFPGLDPGDRA